MPDKKNTESFVKGKTGWPCVSPPQYLTAEGHRVTSILSIRYSRKESLHKDFNTAPNYLPKDVYKNSGNIVSMSKDFLRST